MTNNKRPGIIPGLFVWKLPGIKEKYSGRSEAKKREKKQKRKRNINIIDIVRL